MLAKYAYICTLILSYKLCELKYFIINLVVFVLLLTSIFQRLQIRKANFSYRRHLKVNLLVRAPIGFPYV